MRTISRINESGVCIDSFLLPPEVDLALFATEGTELVDSTDEKEAGIGASFVNGTWSVPLPVPVVYDVSAVQLRKALSRAGLLSQVLAACGKDQELHIEFEYNLRFRSDSPKVAAMCVAINQPMSMADKLFAAANAIPEGTTHGN